MELVIRTFSNTVNASNILYIFVLKRHLFENTNIENFYMIYLIINQLKIQKCLEDSKI